MVQFGESALKKHLLSEALLVVLSLLFLNGCSFQYSLLFPQKTVHSQDRKDSPAGTANWKFPIAIPNGEFLKVVGWLSNVQILYLTNQGETSSLYCYDLPSGKSTLLFNNKYPIEDVQISPARKYILVQTSISSNEAKVTVIDSKGNEKDSLLIPSHELTFEWNPYDESEVLITRFQEDWSFQVSLLNIKQKTLNALSLTQPFLKWINQKEIAYLNGDADDRSLYAPLIFHSITNGKDISVFPEVYQFSTFKNVLMTITVNGDNLTKAKYTFYTPTLKSVAEFEIPQLSNYSDWLVPYYDYNEKTNQFITFRPVKSTSADTYKAGFQLTLYTLGNGKGSVLLKGLDNEPISFSPSGTVCLYGNQFEKIIDLKSKKITNLMKE